MDASGNNRNGGGSPPHDIPSTSGSNNQNIVFDILTIQKRMFQQMNVEESPEEKSRISHAGEKLTDSIFELLGNENRQPSSALTGLPRRLTSTPNPNENVEEMDTVSIGNESHSDYSK